MTISVWGCIYTGLAAQRFKYNVLYTGLPAQGLISVYTGFYKGLYLYIYRFVNARIYICIYTCILYFFKGISLPKTAHFVL